MSARHPWRERAGRAALVLVGVALALVIVEVGDALRAWLRGSGCAHGQPPFWRPRADVGWALAPGASGDAHVCIGTYEMARHAITINALGQRDRPRTLARTPGVARVLVLGDSFVEAMQVDLEESFPALLERRLRVEMLNAGVSGYSTDNELRAFVADGHRYAPDVVLLLFHVGNDVLENGPRLFLQNPHGLPPKGWLRSDAPSRRLDACFAVHRAAAAVAAATPSLLWRNSRLLRGGLTSGVARVIQSACADEIGPSLIRGVPELFGVYGKPATPAWQEGWSTTERLLVHLARRVRASGARFGVVLGPACLEFDPRLRWPSMADPVVREHDWRFVYPYTRLQHFLTAEKIDWLSLQPALRTHFIKTGELTCYLWDGHWNAAGHAVVAESLAPFVMRLLGGT